MIQTAIDFAKYGIGAALVMFIMAWVLVSGLKTEAKLSGKPGDPNLIAALAGGASYCLLASAGWLVLLASLLIFDLIWHKVGA